MTDNLGIPDWKALGVIDLFGYESPTDNLALDRILRLANISASVRTWIIDSWAAYIDGKDRERLPGTIPHTLRPRYIVQEGTHILRGDDRLEVWVQPGSPNPPIWLPHREYTVPEDREVRISEILQDTVRTMNPVMEELVRRVAETKNVDAKPKAEGRNYYPEGGRIERLRKSNVR